MKIENKTEVEQGAAIAAGLLSTLSVNCIPVEALDKAEGSLLNRYNVSLETNAIKSLFAFVQENKRSESVETTAIFHSVEVNMFLKNAKLALVDNDFFVKENNKRINALEKENRELKKKVRKMEGALA